MYLLNHLVGKECTLIPIDKIRESFCIESRTFYFEDIDILDSITKEENITEPPFIVAFDDDNGSGVLIKYSHECGCGCGAENSETIRVRKDWISVDGILVSDYKNKLNENFDILL